MKIRIFLIPIILLILTIAVAAGYFFGFIFLKNKSQLVADRQASINSQISKVEQSINTKKQSEAAIEVRNNVSSHFLQNSEVPTLLSSLELISTRTGSNLKIASVDEIQIAEIGPALSLNVLASGDYASVYKTLVELENLQYLSSIGNFSVSSDQDTETKKTSWTLSANIIIKSYIK